MNGEDLAARLPKPETLRWWSQSLAMVDAVLSPEWELRYFSFDSMWSEDSQMASMRNGSGDDYAIVFSPMVVAIRGFDHESPLSPFQNSPARLPREFIAGLPPEVVEACVVEPAFTSEGVPLLTMVLWWEEAEQRWHYATPGEDVEGEDVTTQLFDELDGEAGTYAAFAAEYYEMELHIEAVAHIFRHEPLTPELVASLNPEADFQAVIEEAQSIGYGRPLPALD